MNKINHIKQANTNEQGVILPVVVILVLVTVATLFYLLTKGILFNNLFNNSVTNPLSQTERSTSQVTSSPTSSAKVIITKTGFVPQTLTVAKNQTVIWINQDKATHQIVSDALSIDSDTLQTNDSYSYTFDTVGTYQLHDRLNPLNIKQTIIVE